VISNLLTRHVKAHSVGRVMFEMIFDLRPTVNRERRPDVAFVSYERWADRSPNAEHAFLGGRARPCN
jgi:hypothetical protein